jgi:hypothetical protein
MNEAISNMEYYKYLIFQIQRSFRLIGDHKTFVNEVKCQIDTDLEQIIKNEQKIQMKGIKRSPFHSNDFMNSGKLIQTQGESLNSSRQSNESIVGGHSSRKVRVSRRSQNIEKSRRSKSIWNRLAESLTMSVKKPYEEYELIPNLRFLRLNNLIFEVAYYENRGLGKIGEMIDGVALLKEGKVDPRVFAKKLDIFEKGYYDFFFEKNEDRHQTQLTFLHQKRRGHLDDPKLGVFYCENKICDLCGKKSSPFDFCFPVEVSQEKNDVYINSKESFDQELINKALNQQAKNVFILPCDSFGKEFKDNYINYLKSKVQPKVT